MTSAITATGLRRSLGGQAALDGIDLELGAGAIFSLLGPSGAGKTTTVQFSAVDSLLTGEENLLLMADLHHLGRAEGISR